MLGPGTVPVLILDLKSKRGGIMSTTACALLGLATWAIVMTVVLLVVRFKYVKGGKSLNSFDHEGRDVDALGYRVTRAHGNTIENLAIPASFLLYALATSQTAITEGLAAWVMWSRVGQSIAHMISTAVPFVLIRATLFTVQIVVCLIWSWKFFHA